jgi:hypothetical protein
MKIMTTCSQVVILFMFNNTVLT